MTIKYNIAQRGNPAKPEAPKKFYPSIQSSGRVSLRELAKQVSAISTISTADTMAMLEALLTVIPQELLRGNIVELGDFGNFWLRSKSEGAESAGEVRGDQVTGLLPRFNPGKEFKKALEEAEFEKA